MVYSLSKPVKDKLQKKLDQLKKENNYRQFTQLSKRGTMHPHALAHTGKNGNDTRPIVNWCSNDYLGFGSNETIHQAMHQAIDQHGSGAGGTRNISGTHQLHVQLEEELATWHSTSSALLFSSGYVANVTSISTLAKLLSPCIIYSDALNHQSMIEGIRRSSCEKRIFKHNDVEDLRTLLESDPVDVCKLIVFESLYSMDGDVAPVKEIVSLAKEKNALTYLDEVHAIGLYGDQGAGIAAQDACDIDVIQGTLGKAFGQFGGYIAADKVLIDAVRSFGDGFIFTTALPPSILAGAITGLDIIKKSTHLRNSVAEKAEQLRKKLKEHHLPIMDGKSHIIPVLVGDAHVCKLISQQLFEQWNIYIQHIGYPTVPLGSERLRITPGAKHDDKMLDKLVTALDQIWNKFDLPRI